MTMVMQIIKMIGGAATVLTGIVSLFWPLNVQGFTGLEVTSGRGITEIRTILGALFIGLGGAVIFFNSREAYLILGITYLVMALVRGISILVDKSPDSSNLISLGVELVFGILLVL